MNIWIDGTFFFCSDGEELSSVRLYFDDKVIDQQRSF